MFKIPQWEDDVPKSKVDFGKSNKIKNNKQSLSESSQKPSNQNKPNASARKKQTKKIKQKQNISSNNQPQSNGFTKVGKVKNNQGTKKDIHKKQDVSIKANFSASHNHAEPRSNGNDIGNINNKKKRPKKRKLDDQGSNEVKKQAKGQGNSSTSDASSKPKKRKLDNEEIAKEGSILLKTNSKKKKRDPVLKPEHLPARSKLDQKKEKLRQILQQETNRNKINVSGDNLRQRMLERLKSAQFRFLNEKLYTTSGSEAQQLFQSDPDAFRTYHEGYQQQVKKWPVNPLDLIVKRLSKMPKTHLIADMGCGEAALSRRVQQQVRSFDLVASAPGVEACDMARTPLLAESVDVAVYCLALMGTDLTQYLIEANRVLKMGGHLLIAEVESRFEKVEKFVEDVERLGFKLKKLDQSQQVFFFLELTKVRAPPAKRGKLPSITLKPCLYKRR